MPPEPTVSVELKHARYIIERTQGDTCHESLIPYLQEEGTIVQGSWRRF